MEHDLIIPNYHVILVHWPLGLLAAGVLIELFSFLWRRSGFRSAGRWMILIGALSAIPAATSGIYAARQALSDEEETSWADLQNSHKFRGQQWEMLRDHVILNSAAVAVFALLVVSWLGASDRVRARLYPIFLLILLAGIGVLAAGAWHGGELVYRYSTGVMTPPTTGPTTHPTTSTSITAMSAHDIRETIEHVIPPIQAHVIMAGWVVALTLASLGLSIRQISMAPDPGGEEAMVDQQLADALAPGRPLSTDVRFDPQKARDSLLGTGPAPILVPPARFWMITFLLAIVTAPLGWWTAGILNFNDAIEYLKSHDRGMAHGALGGSIIVLSVILAMVTRWAGRNRAAVAIFALLLVAALAAQVWVGILLLYDGTTGHPFRLGGG